MGVCGEVVMVVGGGDGSTCMSGTGVVGGMETAVMMYG